MPITRDPPSITKADLTSAVLTVDVPGVAKDGSDATGINPLAGASGIRGWLSSLYSKVSGTLATSRTWVLGSSTDSVTTVPSGIQATSRTWALGSATDSITTVPSGVQSTSKTWNLSSGADSITTVPSGVQTTARSWTLNSATDSVATARTWNLSYLTDTVKTTPDASGVQKVSADSLPLPADAATQTTLALVKTKTDSLDVALSTRLKPADTLAGVTTVTAVTAITNALPSGSNNIGTVNPPAITKGTQGSIGITTQDLKDAGRNVTTFFMTVPILTTNTDTLVSLTGYKSGAAVGATTTPAVVTSGKTYRITSIFLTYVSTAAEGTAKLTLRANTSGVVSISSPIVNIWITGTDAVVQPLIGAPTQVAGNSRSTDMVFPDGIEFAAGTGIGLSLIGLDPTQNAAVTGYAMAAITGYEY